MTVLTLCIRYCVIISLFALFILCCVYYCIDVYFHHVAVVVEINSIQFNSKRGEDDTVRPDPWESFH